MAIQLTYSNRKELRIRAGFSASRRIISKLVQTEISFPRATTSNDIPSGSIPSLRTDCGSIGHETEKALMRFSAVLAELRKIV